MIPYYQKETVTIYHGDCRDVLAQMDAESVDTVITDPPYGLEFMGKEWDKLVAPPRGKTAGSVHKPQIETRDDTPHHRMGVRQPAALKRCVNCGGNSSGEWNRCRCDVSNFAERIDLKHGMQSWHYSWATEVFRVLKPGGMLLAFGGTRTCHRLTCALEDAGFEIRDCLMWLHGQGFPKSLDISKAMDKAAGADREVIESSAKRRRTEYLNRDNARKDYRPGEYQKRENILDITAPTTDAAKQWDGWGTALKPAWEPIILAMKPLDGTFSENAQKHGVAGLNVDGCRIEGAQGVWGSSNADCQDGRVFNASPTGEEYRSEQHRSGRWPANLVFSHRPECEEVGTKRVKPLEGHRPNPVNVQSDGNIKFNENLVGFQKLSYTAADGLETVTAWNCAEDCPVKMLDEQSGERKAGGNLSGNEPSRTGGPGTVAYGEFKDRMKWDSGGASRFFYCAKASRSERGEGNLHPTVKPLALMRWLCRLTKMPTGGVILDQFMGSGTTGVAAVLEGRRFIGIEQSEQDCAIAVKRILEATRQGALTL